MFISISKASSIGLVMSSMTVEAWIVTGSMGLAPIRRVLSSTASNMTWRYVFDSSMPNSSNNFSWSRSGLVRLMLTIGSSNICTLERAERTRRGRIIVSFVGKSERASGRREPTSTVSLKLKLSTPWLTSSVNSSSCGAVVSSTKALGVTGID